MKINRSLVSFFIWTFAFSWLVWIPAVVNSLGRLPLPFPNMALVILGAHGPLVAALTLTHKEGGWTAVKALLRAGFDLRLKLLWWLAIILVPFALGGVAVWVSAQQSGFEFDKTLWFQPVMILPTFFIMFFLGGSFQEEFGWRGYALPKLLEAGNPISASLILGAVWGVWHYPLFHIVGASQSFMRFEVFLALTIAFSFLFTWFYLKTNNNLFTALLLHTAINTAISLFPPIEQRLGGNQSALTYLTLLYVVVAALLILKDRAMWFKTAE